MYSYHLGKFERMAAGTLGFSEFVTPLRDSENSFESVLFSLLLQLQSGDLSRVILREVYLSWLDAWDPAAQSVILVYTISFLFLFISLYTLLTLVEGLTAFLLLKPRAWW